MCKSLSLVVEDVLSDSALRIILKTIAPKIHIAATHGLQGNGYIRRKISSFNKSSRGGHAFLVLTDLDNGVCPSKLIQEWLPETKETNLLFRVAVREVETWLMADKNGMADFLFIPANHIPDDVENIQSPKEFLMNAARRSSNRTIREDIPPRSNSTAKTGPDYNGALIRFAGEHWNISNAKNNSASLQRAITCIENFAA